MEGVELRVKLAPSPFSHSLSSGSQRAKALEAARRAEQRATDITADQRLAAESIAKAHAETLEVSHESARRAVRGFRYEWVSGSACVCVAACVK